VGSSFGCPKSIVGHAEPTPRLGVVRDEMERMSASGGTCDRRVQRVSGLVGASPR
jgi:hypothetical protein